MPTICFEVDADFAREVKRLPDPLERLAALTTYFDLLEQKETTEQTLATAPPSEQGQRVPDTVTAAEAGTSAMVDEVSGVVPVDGPRESSPLDVEAQQSARAPESSESPSPTIPVDEFVVLAARGELRRLLGEEQYARRAGEFSDEAIAEAVGRVVPGEAGRSNSQRLGVSAAQVLLGDQVAGLRGGGLRDQVDHYRHMRGIAGQAGLAAQDVPADGNCFYYSLAVLLGRATDAESLKVAAQEIRNELADALPSFWHEETQAHLVSIYADDRAAAVTGDSGAAVAVADEITDRLYAAEDLGRSEVLSAFDRILRAPYSYSNGGGDIAPYVAVYRYGIDLHVLEVSGRPVFHNLSSERSFNSDRGVSTGGRRQVVLVRDDALRHWIPARPAIPGWDPGRGQRLLNSASAQHPAQTSQAGRALSSHPQQAAARSGSGQRAEVTDGPFVFDESAVPDAVKAAGENARSHRGRGASAKSGSAVSGPASETTVTARPTPGRPLPGTPETLAATESTSSRPGRPLPRTPETMAATETTSSRPLPRTPETTAATETTSSRPLPQAPGATRSVGPESSRAPRRLPVPPTGQLSRQADTVPAGATSRTAPVDEFVVLAARGELRRLLGEEQYARRAGEFSDEAIAEAVGRVVPGEAGRSNSQRLGVSAAQVLLGDQVAGLKGGAPHTTRTPAQGSEELMAGGASLDAPSTSRAADGAQEERAGETAATPAEAGRQSELEGTEVSERPVERQTGREPSAVDEVVPESSGSGRRGSQVSSGAGTHRFHAAHLAGQEAVWHEGLRQPLPHIVTYVNRTFDATEITGLDPERADALQAHLTDPNSSTAAWKDAVADAVEQSVTAIGEVKFNNNIILNLKAEEVERFALWLHIAQEIATTLAFRMHLAHDTADPAKFLQICP